MKLLVDIPEEYKEQFIKNKCDDLFNSLATNEFGYVLRKSFETATLETQPCEDCISREAVDEYITNLLSGYLYDEERTRLEDLTTYIWELPSVTPKAESRNVLAEIKAEIEQKCCITVGSDNEPAITLYDVFQIIDKYRKGGVE